MNLKRNVQSYGRFKNLPWFDKISDSYIFVGGAGGIGSWLVLFLARTGANVVVVDMDTVEEHNIAGQVYGKGEIGKKKVDAIESVASSLCGENNITPIDTEITEEPAQWQSIITRCEAVCVGFDNLKARGLVYKEWLLNGKEDSIFIDGRLSAENGQVYVVTKQSTPEELAAYESTYFSDSEKVELPCTMKATSHCGALIASLMTAEVVNWFNNIAGNPMPRTISNIEFHLPLMLIEQPVLKCVDKPCET